MDCDTYGDGRNVGDVVWKARRHWERCAVFGQVFRRVLDNVEEVVRTCCFISGDCKQDGKQIFPNARNVAVVRFVLDVREGFLCLFEEGGDIFRSHGDA